jgi:hypothetical protein
MPTGRATRSSGIGIDQPASSAAAATFSTKKLKYLKNPSTARLAEIDAVSRNLRRPASSVRSSSRPTHQSSVLVKPSRPRKRQSHQP